MKLTRRIFMGLVGLKTLVGGLLKFQPTPTVVCDPQPDFLPAESLPVTSVIPEWVTKLNWGTFGKEGKGPLRVLRLMDCETDHLQAILRTESWHLESHYSMAISCILECRGVQPLPASERLTVQQRFGWPNHAEKIS